MNKVDGQTEMSDAEVYAANVNSVVSINVTGTNSNNFFGQPVQKMCIRDRKYTQAAATMVLPEPTSP